MAEAVCVAELNVMVQVGEVPEHSPPQPANVHPASDVAVSVTMLPAG